MKLLSFLSILSYSLIYCAELISIPLHNHQLPANNEIKFDNETVSSSHLRKFALTAAPTSIDAAVTNLENSIYTLQIQVGTSKQPFNLLMDTGSNIMWLPTTAVTNKIFESYYNCQTSDGCNYKTPAETKTINYAQGSVSGSVGTIPMSVGSLAPVTESLILVNKVADQPQAKYSGLIGLGPSNELNAGGQTWVQNYFKQDLIPNPEFSVYLAFNTSQSELTLGGVNPKYQGVNSTLSTFKADLNSIWWSLRVNQFSMGSFFTTNFSFTGTLVLDTGFTLIGTEDKLWQEIARSLKKQIGSIEIVNNVFLAVTSCSSVTFWPNITFTLPDTTGALISYDLEPGYYMRKLDNDLCLLPFQRMAIGGDVKFAVGQSFLRKYMAVYSYSPAQVQIVRSINETPEYQYGSDDSGLPTYAYVLIGIGAALVAFGIMYGVYRCWKKRQDQRKKDQTLTTSLQKHPF